MKKYKFFTTAIIAVLYLSIVSLNAQNFRADYRLNLQPITEVAITDDGGTGFLAVVSGINTLNREIIMLVKLNYKFDVEWTKSLDYTLYAGDICAYDVKRDPNGGYAICGRYINNNPPNLGGFLMRIDDIGIVKWIKDAREIYNTDRCEELRSVEIVGNHYICCGYSVDNGQPKEGFIWSVDKYSMVVEWTKTEISDFPNQVDVVLNDIVYNSGDQLLYTCGSWYDAGNTTPKEMVLASYDLNGNNIISQKYTNINITSMKGKALAVYNQNVYITGNMTYNNSEDVFVSCIQTNGNFVWNRRLDVSNRDQVEDIVYFDNQLYYAGSTEYQNKEGLIMQTDINGNPAFSAIYFGLQYPAFEFHKMIYRNVYTNPSIIKIGFYSLTNKFSIAETYLSYNQGCSDQVHSVDMYSQNLQQTIVSTDHTKIDFNNFPIIGPVSEPTDELIICVSPYFSPGPIHDKSAIVQPEFNTQENSNLIIVLYNQIIFPSSYKNGIYKLYSLEGRLIAEGNISNNYSIDISMYNKGIYLLHLQSTDNKSKTIKIIK